MVIDRSSNSDIAAGFGTTADRRAAVEREQQERAAERSKQLASQVSPLNEPQERIRIWERLHGLNLPVAASHKLVRVIATQTDLTIQQVQDEQKRRATGGTAGVTA
jgi:uncharacterized protein YmfQ (DUF2313 family)